MEQTRLEVQMATLNWVVSFMQQYGIPASMMEDALNKALLQIKDQVVADLLNAAAQAQPEQIQPEQVQLEPDEAPRQEEDVND